VIKGFDAERRGKVDPDADGVCHELWRGGWALVETVDTDDKRLLLLRKGPSCLHANTLNARELWAIRALGSGLGLQGYRAGARDRREHGGPAGG
jgi:hypothetical protein